MNDRQENKASMIYKVDLFLTNNITELEAVIPAITGIFSTWSNHVNNLQNYEQEATEDITGYAVQKQLNRTTARDKAIQVSGGYVAYLLLGGHNETANKYNFTKSGLDAMRDTEFLYKLGTLSEAVGPIAPATLNPFGVTGTLKTELETAITAFKQFMPSTGDQKAESASNAVNVEKTLELIDELLVTLDYLMRIIITSHPVLYYQYLFDRKIDDNISGGSTTPDVVLTIAPGVFQNVLTVPFLSSRSFKAKNLSADTINWGLSTLATSFTDIVHTVDGGAESIKLSSTLAPSGVGDIVLFQNTSANPIDIELTVLE